MDVNALNVVKQEITIIHGTGVNVIFVKLQEMKNIIGKKTVKNVQNVVKQERNNMIGVWIVKNAKI